MQILCSRRRQKRHGGVAHSLEIGHALGAVVSGRRGEQDGIAAVDRGQNLGARRLTPFGPPIDAQRFAKPEQSARAGLERLDAQRLIETDAARVAIDMQAGDRPPAGKSFSLRRMRGRVKNGQALAANSAQSRCDGGSLVTRLTRHMGPITWTR
jgi:hypothetical protein